MKRGVFDRNPEPAAAYTKRLLRGFLGLAGCLFLVHGALGQQSALNSPSLVYMSYPQPAGSVKPLELKDLPRWITLDMQARAREENQSSDKYVSGNDAVYVLTRMWGGLEVRPTRWLTGYMQFVRRACAGVAALLRCRQSAGCVR